MVPTPDSIDLLDPRILSDPYAAYDVLREQAPVYEMPGMGFFVVTSHEGVLDAFRQPDLFSADLGEADVPGFLRTPEARAILGGRGVLPRCPMRTETGRRLVFDSGLAARIAHHWSVAVPSVRAIVADLLAGLEARGACDFVSEVCAPLPLMVMADRLGLSLEDLPGLEIRTQAWVRLICYGMTPKQELEVATLRRELRDYLAEQLARRRGAPSGDLLSDLACIGKGGENGDGGLSDDDRISLAEELLAGGNDATSDALASGMLLLLRDPRLADLLRADGSKLPAFVDEVLRLESPLAGVLRRTTRDAELLGVKIPEQRLVHLRIAAANRDPRVFEDPDRLDLARPNARAHLAFGGGALHCPGATLTRLLMRTLYAQALERWQRLELAVPETELAYLPSFSQRGLRELPLRFHARTSARG